MEFEKKKKTIRGIKTIHEIFVAIKSGYRGLKLES